MVINKSKYYRNKIKMSALSQSGKSDNTSCLPTLSMNKHGKFAKTYTEKHKGSCSPRMTGYYI